MLDLRTLWDGSPTCELTMTAIVGILCDSTPTEHEIAGVSVATHDGKASVNIGMHKAKRWNMIDSAPASVRSRHTHTFQQNSAQNIPKNRLGTCSHSPWMRVQVSFRAARPLPTRALPQKKRGPSPPRPAALSDLYTLSLPLSLSTRLDKKAQRS